MGHKMLANGLFLDWLIEGLQPQEDLPLTAMLGTIRYTIFIRSEWVVSAFGAQVWAEPAYDPASFREMIFNRLANSDGGGGDMPEPGRQTTLSHTIR